MNVKGVPLELHPPGDHVSDVIRDTGDFYEAAILDEARRRVVARGGRAVIVDAGAMIGSHTAYFAHFMAPAAVHAFEPSPVNLPLLQANVGGYPSVWIHPFALSDTLRWVTLEADPVNMGHVMTVPSKGGPGAVVAMPLDAYLLPELSLLKVDVEGHEPQVIAGARATIERCRPLVLIEDWHGSGHAQELLPGYRLAAEWERDHQTFLFEPA